MWEWNYAKEPFDLKLMCLLLLKKLWLPVTAALLGAVIAGGARYIQKEVLGGPKQYEITSTYYVEYATDPRTGDEYTYINDASWKNWVVTDLFVDRVWDNALTAGMEPEIFQIEKEDIRDYLTAALPTDLRVPSSTVTTPRRELTAVLGKALEEAFLAFAGDQKEIDSIKVVDTTEVTAADRDSRVLRACILGAVLFLMFALLFLFLGFCADTSIYIPETFSFRYGLPMLGALAGTGDGMELTAGTAENIKYVFSDKKKIAVTAVDTDADMRSAVKLLPEGPVYTCVPSTEQTPEGAVILREADGVLLLVRAGAHNGKVIEHMLHYLKIQECQADGALLYGADQKLLKAYRLPEGWRKSR